MKTRPWLPLLLLALLSLSRAGHAQGTTIGYQGHLNDGGAPATGLYDFTFGVFDAEAAGAALAANVALDAVPVTNGVFSASLDFGPELFTGPPRWLEITVRTNEAGVPSVLSPRTPLLPAPYAIFAGKAGSVANGTVTADQLNSGGVPPSPGQFLSYDGGRLVWSDPAIAVGELWSRNAALDAYYNGGNVGIGTSGPLAPLEVNGILRSTRNGVAPQYVQLNGGDSGSIKLTAQSTAGAEKALFIQNLSNEARPGENNNIQFDLGTTAAHSTKMIIDASGHVGIGTSTPASKLTIQTGFLRFGIGQLGFEHTDGNVRLATYLDDTAAYLGTLSQHALSFYVHNNAQPSLTINGDGSISMASGPGYVFVGTPNGESGTTIKRGNNRADVRFDGVSLKLVAGPGNGPPPSTSGITVTTLGNVGIGTTTPSRTLEVYGDLLARDGSFRVLEIRGGADLAEPFAMSHGDVEPGTVVVIDDDHPGRLRRSTEAYDKKVAGIISGANGIRPGISMIQENKLDAGENVALSGRVYVQADASLGPIKPGDLLTTSNTPGHAMKVTEPARAQGAILGKAMSGLKDGKGLVLVLVTLQ